MHSSSCHRHILKNTHWRKRQITWEECITETKYRGELKQWIEPWYESKLCLFGHWIRARFILCPEIRERFTALINTRIWLVLWALATCILASAACRIKTCKLRVFLQSVAKSRQKAWPHSLSLLFCPWLTQCQSQELACPKSRFAVGSTVPVSSPSHFPLPSLYQYPVTRTQCRAKALVGLSIPTEALYLEPPAHPHASSPSLSPLLVACPELCQAGERGKGEEMIEVKRTVLDLPAPASNSFWYYKTFSLF